jgi:hypothetical protein
MVVLKAAKSAFMATSRLTIPLAARNIGDIITHDQMSFYPRHVVPWLEPSPASLRSTYQHELTAPVPIALLDAFAERFPLDFDSSDARSWMHPLRYTKCMAS